MHVPLALRDAMRAWSPEETTSILMSSARGANAKRRPQLASVQFTLTVSVTRAWPNKAFRVFMEFLEML